MKRIVFLLALNAFSVHVFAQFDLVKELAGQMSQDSLLTYVKQLTGLLPVSTPQGDQVISNRLSGSAGNELTALFIRQKLAGWGIAYSEVNFSPTGQNIIGEIRGRREGKVLMVGAHFDAVGTNAPGIFYPGADDNASGTAAVLEMARVCAGRQFPVTLHFAFWDEEEQNLIGSRASAPSYMNNLAGYINLDMIAYDSNNDSAFEIHARPAGYSSEMGVRASELIALYDVPLKARVVNPGDPSTDHGSFWENNLTAIGINEEYTNDFTPHWHKLTDSLVYFNVSYFTRMSKFAATAFLHFAMDSHNLVGVGEASLNDRIGVYPNPFGAEIRLSVPQDHRVVHAALLDATGRQVFGSATDGLSIHVPPELVPGLYHLVLTDESGNSYRRKLVKR